MKVFCKECKWLGGTSIEMHYGPPIKTRNGAWCFNDKVLDMSDWFSVYSPHPSETNKNNDCPYFEKREGK
jgi:hypothetical protein